MDQHDLDAIIKHLQADPVVKACFSLDYTCTRLWDRNVRLTSPRTTKLLSRSVTRGLIITQAVYDAKSEEIGPGIYRFKAEIGASISGPWRLRIMVIKLETGPPGACLVSCIMWTKRLASRSMTWRRNKISWWAYGCSRRASSPYRPLWNGRFFGRRRGGAPHGSAGAGAAAADHPRCRRLQERRPGQGPQRIRWVDVERHRKYHFSAPSMTGFQRPLCVDYSQRA